MYSKITPGKGVAPRYTGAVPVQTRSAKAGKMTYFGANFWRPSRCPNELHDGSLEGSLSLFSKSAFNF